MASTLALESPRSQTWPVTQKVVCHFLFWSWNGIFILFVAAGLGPNLLPDFIRDAVRGLLPASLALTLAAVLIIPPAATVLGLIFFRKRPLDLLRIFYGIEMPLFFVCLARLFLVRQMTAPQILLTAFAATGLVAFTLELRRRPLFLSRATPLLKLSALTLLLGVTTYVGAILTFYAIPVVSAILAEAIRFRWVDELIEATFRSPQHFFMGGLATLLFAYTATLLFALPIVATWLHFKEWLRNFRHVGMRHRPWVAPLLAAGTLCLAVGAMAFSTVQPQARAFALLAEKPTNELQRRELLDHAGAIRDGLLNAYLASYRYHGTEGRQGNVRKLWRNAFGPDWEDMDRVEHLHAWEGVQEAHDTLAAPWLYHDDLHVDSNRAPELYEAFFDTPLQRGDRDEVLAALSSTWERDSIEAGLLDRDAETVWLASQDIDVKEHGDWAQIEIHEVYENQTFELQEVLYYFALPESAVISGLWLGESPDREHAFRFTVAPRGAAQKVYRQEVRRRIDPALIEQVGPVQYRLRAFPIPARDSNFEKPTPRMHLWLHFLVLAEEGGWPMPRLLEKRNVYWTGDTLHQLDDEVLGRPGDGWLWPRVAAKTLTPRQPHDVLLGSGLRVNATPMTNEDFASFPTPQLRLAVVVDRSYSMTEHADALRSDVTWLQNHARDITWFFTSAPSRGEKPKRVPSINSNEILFYGGHATSLLLNQFAQLSAGESYDAVIVLTDEGGYELEPEDCLVEYEDQCLSNPLTISSPVWLIHLGGEVPIAYSDTVLETMQKTAGGVAFSAREAIARIALADKKIRLARDGFLWEVNTNAPVGSLPDPFAPLAARAAIDALIPGIDATTNTQLDILHAIAKTHEVVTPYSSMIVLVEDRQREALQRASEEEDRFARKAESGKEFISRPPGTDVSGVPEPEEWALLTVALGLLLAYLRRSALQRRQTT
ncbi:TIGR02921 family PEP-CTERM protein [Myxococcota bacterium]